MYDSYGTFWASSEISCHTQSCNGVWCAIVAAVEMTDKIGIQCRPLHSVAHMLVLSHSVSVLEILC